MAFDTRPSVHVKLKYIWYKTSCLRQTKVHLIQDLLLTSNWSTFDTRPPVHVKLKYIWYKTSCSRQTKVHFILDWNLHALYHKCSYWRVIEKKRKKLFRFFLSFLCMNSNIKKLRGHKVVGTISHKIYVLFCLVHCVILVQIISLVSLFILVLLFFVIDSLRPFLGLRVEGHVYPPPLSTIIYTSPLCYCLPFPLPGSPLCLPPSIIVGWNY